ncbi:MAG: hypothetical protein R3B08_10055 [Nitrospira sp.]
MGQRHIEIALEKLHRKYGAEVTLHAPKIPYRETVRSVAQAQGKYKKQTGGHGQYGDCWLEVGPLPRGQGSNSKIKSSAVPFLQFRAGCGEGSDRGAARGASGRVSHCGCAGDGV